MENDETTEQQAETSPTIETQTEAVQTAENAEQIAEAAEANTYALASYVTILEERIAALEGRLENDERNNTESTGTDRIDSGIGRSPDIETETHTEDERTDSRPNIQHWFWGKR